MGNELNKKSAKPEFVLYLAVLPKYRTECIRLLKEALGSRLTILISSAHLDPSVKSGIPAEFYREVSIIRLLGGRAFVQVGHFRTALAASTTVVDLNPRSISAWAILAVRRVLKRRTLVWGHIHPQAGASARTAKIRSGMRTMAAGTISYTYRDAGKALEDIPGQKVWTAPNSLYLEKAILPAKSSLGPRTDVLYVGRFAPSKKVDVLVRGFSLAASKVDSMRLILVGGGAEETQLKKLVNDLGIEARVIFPGWIDDATILRSYYERAFCTASPGFAGLGLTQSLGFGVPMIIADKEPHSPEIELDESGGVSYFESDSDVALSKELLIKWEKRESLPDAYLSGYTRDRYSAEAMAGGLLAALNENSAFRARIEVP